MVRSPVKRKRKNTPEYLEEVARAAETMASDRIEEAITLLRQYNVELALIDEHLRDLLPKVDGVVLMERGGCASPGEVGCIGCPHVRWVQWSNPAQKAKREYEHIRAEALRRGRKEPKFYPRPDSWQRHRIDQPLRKLRRAGDFEESHAEAKALIKRAVEVNEKKMRLVKHLSNLSRSLQQTEA